MISVLEQDCVSVRQEENRKNIASHPQIAGLNAAGLVLARSKGTRRAAFLPVILECRQVRRNMVHNYKYRFQADNTAFLSVVSCTRQCSRF